STVDSNCNTFAVTITNNTNTAMKIRFDINGTTPLGKNDVIDIVTSSIASKGRPTTDLTWGGTSIEVAKNDTTTLYLTYNAKSERGAPTEIYIYFDTLYAGSDNEHSGDVTIGEFKFADFSDPELPENVTLVNTDADVVLSDESDKVYFVLKGKTEGGEVDDDTLEAYLKWNHFDLQQTGGRWTNYDSLARIVTVNGDGTWEIKFDVTALPVDGAAYTSHFGQKDPSDPTYSDNKWSDVKLDVEHAPHGKSVELNGKKYSISNVPEGTTQADNWGCVSLRVEEAQSEDEDASAEG
ncbi:MAG: hypothetical protein J1F39_04670, partial [Clostridiales bacterium]|nr:hypothetical protein [Clostridiales bacterium]